MARLGLAALLAALRGMYHGALVVSGVRLANNHHSANDNKGDKAAAYGQGQGPIRQRGQHVSHIGEEPRRPVTTAGPFLWSSPTD